MQKEAEQKLAAAAKKAGGSSPGGGADAGKVGAGGSLGGAKERPLLFDLVFEGEADLCIKVGAGLWQECCERPCRRQAVEGACKDSLSPAQQRFSSAVPARLLAVPPAHPPGKA